MMTDQINKEAQKALERLRAREGESLHEWANRLAQSDVEFEESLPDKDRTKAIKGIKL
jgi:hypothetical protein